MVAHAQALVKVYGQGAAAQRVLDGADLVVEPGELVTVLGRSGSGKSTLLHLLGGLDRPDAGAITVAGQRLDGASEAALNRVRRRHVGFVFQAYHLIPELTGEENVLLAARMVDGRPAAARGRRLIEELGVAQAAGRRPDQLSGGEQQRLAIARALVNRPRLVLADEPTGNLDEASGRRVLELLRAVAAGDRAVVLVTHDADAAAMADRVLTLEAGRLVG